MRPPVPDVAPSRARKASLEQQQQWSDPRNSVPATFFLSRSDPDDDGNGGDHAAGSPDNSMYGVQSLDETVHQATVAAPELSPNPANDSLPLHDDGGDNDNDNDDEDYHEAFESARRRSTIKAFELLNFKSDPPSSDSAFSRPLTPLNLNHPEEPSSLPSSPKSLSSHSLKPLDDISITDEQSSQAIVSGEEDNEGQEVPEPGTDSMPQLIMPSLSMPSRRPFTERGKAMGRLKVLLAGAAGSGKTSLIKSIVQECEDIVHVDPFPPPSSPSRPRRSSRSRTQHGTRTAISEIYASTKPYPSWWSDLEDSRVLRRRKSMGDIVLERNLCFVDSTRAEQTDVIVHYMHQQLVRAIAAPDTSHVDFQNMLAGNGGSQVDAIIYLISQDTLAADVKSIRKFSDFTNVIPIISKADLMSPEQVAALKSSFQKQIQTAGIKPFLFGNPSLGETYAQVPFAVSSSKSSDYDIMDASTLMSPDYVQSLVPSELSLLIQNLFDRDYLAWMRHSAAKKLVQRQYEQPTMRYPGIQNTSPSPSLGSPSMSGLDSPNLSVSSASFISPPSDSLSYTLARVADYTQREEKLAQVQLVKWAADLQRSLQNERERYAAMAQGNRAIWLTERLSESVMDGSLVPITQTAGLGAPEKAGIQAAQRQNGQGIEYRITRLSPHDPLGVVWWTDDLKQRGWVIFQIVGGFGVMGGLALWLARAWGIPSSRGLSDWYLHCCGSD